MVLSTAHGAESPAAESREAWRGQAGAEAGAGQPAGAVQHRAGAPVCRAQASLEAGQPQGCRRASGQGQRPVLRGGQPRIKLTLCGSRSHRRSWRCGLALAPRQETCIRRLPRNACAAAVARSSDEEPFSFLATHTPRGGWAADKGLPRCARPTCTASLHGRLKCGCQGHLSKATRGDGSLFSAPSTGPGSQPPGSAFMILIPSFCS